MKKTILLLMILSILILAACSKTETGTTGGDSTAASSSGDESFAGSLANAMKLGKSFKCTATSNEGTSEVYVKGNKVRTESTISPFIAIMDENKCMWMWENGKSQGTKLCVPEEQKTPAQSSTPAPQGQVKTDMNVECKATSISDSMFVPPSNVQFTDLQETLNQAMSSVPTVPSGADVPEMPNDLGNVPSSDSGY